MCLFQVKAFGPGLQSSGLAVGKPTEFTVDAKQGGSAPLKILAQVGLRVFPHMTRNVLHE